MIKLIPISKFHGGFNLLELLVVVAITAVLTTLVMVNFQTLRSQQELQAAGDDFISKIREIQNFVLSGKVISGSEASDYYEIVFSSPATTYNIYYNIGAGNVLLETVRLPQNMEINQLLVQGSARSTVVVRITAPFARILLDSAANQVFSVRFNHQKTSRTRIILVDGVSGRIGME